MSSHLSPPSSAPSRLSVTHHDLGYGTCEVTIAGEIDLASAPNLKAALMGLFRDGHRGFVLEVSGVTHIDSTGLGVLIAFDRRIHTEGMLTIARAGSAVTKLLTLTGLDSHFPTFPTVDEAVTYVRAGSAPAHPSLDPDAALAVALASTALPFSDSRRGEVRRWLRILQLPGAGTAASALQINRAQPNLPEVPPEVDMQQLPGHTVAEVAAHATRIAADRESPAVGTVELLLALLALYGHDFDHVMQEHGQDTIDLIRQLGDGLTASSVS
jgi:anti-sigma B factor antagonist